MAKILIVGGGVAGLSAGIYAQFNGHQAVIYEQHKVPGGNLTGWQRGEYHIDNCIHWLTGTNPNTSNYKMWRDLGVLGDTEIMKLSSLYTCEHKGKRLSLHRDLYKIKDEMLLTSPDDRVEILKFIKAVEILQYICDIGGKEHDKGCGVSFYFRHLPILIRYYRMSTGDLAKKFKHPALQDFISCFLGRDFAALALIFVFAHFTGENGDIPRGSSYAMAQRMAHKFTSLGGELITDTAVKKIERIGTYATSALLSSGERVTFDYAIITADPSVAFSSILDVPMPKRLSLEYDDNRFFRFSSYHCAFSCNTDKLDFTGDFIFKIPKEYQEKLHTTHLILREFSHEKDFSPSGKSIIQSITFCSEKDCYAFIELKKNQLAYKAHKTEIGKIIQKLITDKFPRLQGKLECIDVWTPATYKRYVGSEIGSYMGFAMPARYIPPRISCKIKGLDNVFLATQWQQAPGGLPIAALCGKTATEKICVLEEQKLKRRVKKPVAVGITQ